MIAHIHDLFPDASDAEIDEPAELTGGQLRDLAEHNEALKRFGGVMPKGEGKRPQIPGKVYHFAWEDFNARSVAHRPRTAEHRERNGGENW